MQSEPSKFISTGGVGDAFIILLKLKDWSRQNEKSSLDWLHVENADIRVEFEDLLPFATTVQSHSSRIEFLYDPLYAEHVRGNMWKDRIVIPTPVRGTCPFHGKEWPLRDPFISSEDFRKKHDICIQVAAGQRHSRLWGFMPRTLMQIYADLNVVLIGNDPFFKDERDQNNLVCKQRFSDALKTIRQSKLFIGLSGVMNYFACANRIPNIHLIESDSAEDQYYHESWKELTHSVRKGSLPEVLAVIKLMQQRRAT